MGILHELRGGAYLIRVADPTVKDEFEVARWATLLEGAERAWLNGKPKVSKAVQVSVAEGLKHCKVCAAIFLMMSSCV